MGAAPHPSGLRDTDILIDEARGFAAAAVFLNEQHAADVHRISIVTAMELIRGCRSAAELRQVRRLLGLLVVLPISDAASQSASPFMDTIELSHGLAIPDALIAATALDHNLPLHPKTVRHFQAIPGIVVIRPN